MTRYITYLSWPALFLALSLWAAVFFADRWIQEEARSLGASAKSAEQRADEAAGASRIRALAQESAADRERLENAARADIVEIADEIESAGRSVGVVARVHSAMPAGGSVELPGESPLASVSFIVQAEGSFAGVAQFLRALESFPGFSNVEQFDFDRVPSVESGSQPWRTSIRLTVYTTSDIAS